MPGESEPFHQHTLPRLSYSRLTALHSSYPNTLELESLQLRFPLRDFNHNYVLKPPKTGPFYVRESAYCSSLEGYWHSIFTQDLWETHVQSALGGLVNLEDIYEQDFSFSPGHPLIRKDIVQSHRTGIALGFINNVPVAYATSPWLLGVYEDSHLVFDKKGRIDFAREGLTPVSIVGAKLYLPISQRWKLLEYFTEEFTVDTKVQQPTLIQLLTAELAHRLGNRIPADQFLTSS